MAAQGRISVSEIVPLIGRWHSVVWGRWPSAQVGARAIFCWFLGGRVNGPITFWLDGKKYLVVGAGDTLFAFARSQK